MFVDFVAIVFVSLSVFCIGFALYMCGAAAGSSKVFASDNASGSLRRTHPWVEVAGRRPETLLG